MSQTCAITGHAFESRAFVVCVADRCWDSEKEMRILRRFDLVDEQTRWGLETCRQRKTENNWEGEDSR